MTCDLSAAVAVVASALIPQSATPVAVSAAAGRGCAVHTPLALVPCQEASVPALTKFSGRRPRSGANSGARSEPSRRGGGTGHVVHGSPEHRESTLMEGKRLKRAERAEGNGEVV